MNWFQKWLFHELNQQFRSSEDERCWANLQNLDIKRSREVHLLVDELRTRLRQLKIFVPQDIEADEIHRRKNPIFQQQNLLNLKVTCEKFNRSIRLFAFVLLDNSRWSLLSELLHSRTDRIRKCRSRIIVQRSVENNYGKVFLLSRAHRFHLKGRPRLTDRFRSLIFCRTSPVRGLRRETRIFLLSFH